MGSALTQREIQRRILKAHKGQDYEYPYFDTETTRTANRLTVVCKKHGVCTLNIRDIVYKGCKCPKCRRLVYDGAEYIKRLTDFYGDRLDFSKSVYKGVLKPITFRCPVHGYVTKSSARDLLRQGNGCPKCARSLGVVKQHQSRALKIKSSYIVDIGGKSYKVDSACEELVLRKLLSMYKTLITNNIPVIRYTFKRKSHLYLPDFYIKHTRTLIEVKSPVTLGLAKFFPHTHYNVYKQCCAKAKACIEAGYKIWFVLVLYWHTKKPRAIVLPSEWFLLSKRELVSYIWEKFKCKISL